MFFIAEPHFPELPAGDLSQFCDPGVRIPLAVHPTKLQN